MNHPPAPEPPFGERLKRLRTRRGMTREVLGGLVGRSSQWVKAVETGRLRQPRLHMLLRLAEALRVRDLAELTGSAPVPMMLFIGPGHPALPAVRDAVNAAPWDTPDMPPPSLEHLKARLAAAWRARHASPDHRTVLGAILPLLIRDGHHAVRSYEGDEGRRARAILAGIYNLAQFFTAYQPDGGLLWRIAERSALMAAESSDPLALGGAAWLLAQAHRDVGEYEAAHDVGHRALAQLEPRIGDADYELAGMYGALLFEAAYTAARSGQRGEAWRYWDQAEAVARRLPAGFYDPMTSFSRVIMGAHAVTVAVEARQKGESARQAARSAALAIPSRPRRGRHLIEVARAHHLADDTAAALGTLEEAYRAAPETVPYNGYAKTMLAELSSSGPAGLRKRAARLAASVGVP